MAVASAGYRGLGFSMNWTAPASAEFIVQYTETLNPPVWITIPVTLRSTDGNFHFSDDGRYTLPISSNRFYRLVRAR
jgi:hypothetical protein